MTATSMGSSFTQAKGNLLEESTRRCRTRILAETHGPKEEDPGLGRFEAERVEGVAKQGGVAIRKGKVCDDSVIGLWNGVGGKYTIHNLPRLHIESNLADPHKPAADFLIPSDPHCRQITVSQVDVGIE